MGDVMDDFHSETCKQVLLAVCMHAANSFKNSEFRDFPWKILTKLPCNMRNLFKMSNEIRTNYPPNVDESSLLWKILRFQ